MSDGGVCEEAFALPPRVQAECGEAGQQVTPPEARMGLSPRDLAYRRSMTGQTILLTRRTNLWLLAG
jgi:hypothetical protein